MVDPKSFWPPTNQHGLGGVAFAGSIQTRHTGVLPSHQKNMPYLHFRSTQPTVPALIFAGIFLVSGASLIVCSSKDNPDEIRQRTAEATATMKRDVKAVAEGVKEGMSRDKTLNMNRASREDLLNYSA